MYDKLIGGIVFDIDVPQAETKAVKVSRVYGLPVSRSFHLRSRSIKGEPGSSNADAGLDSTSSIHHLNLELCTDRNLDYTAVTKTPVRVTADSALSSPIIPISTLLRTPTGE
jgi:hypothetical protein